MTITINMTFEDAAEAAHALSRMAEPVAFAVNQTFAAGSLKIAPLGTADDLGEMKDALESAAVNQAFTAGGVDHLTGLLQRLSNVEAECGALEERTYTLEEKVFPAPSASAALESARGLGPKPAEPSVGHVAVFSALTGNALAGTAHILPAGAPAHGDIVVSNLTAEEAGRARAVIEALTPSAAGVTKSTVAEWAAALTSPPVLPAQPATVPTPPTAAIAPTGVLVKPLSSILVRDTVSAAQSGWTEADFERVYGTPFSPPGTAGPLFSEEQVALAKEYQGPDGPARWAKRIYDAEMAAATPPTAAIVPPAAPDAADLDVNGMPWDSRLHAGTKTKNADGTWRALRKAPAAKAAIEADIKTSQAAPAATVPPPPGSAVETFAQYMARIGPVFAAAPDQASADMTAALAAFGLTHIGQLASRPDLIPGVDAKFWAGAAP